jgi:branched-chain amino acid transport system substrate-binding protein
MKITRRHFTTGLGTAAIAAPAIIRTARGASEPIRIGYPASLTGALSAGGIGFHLGAQFVVDEANAAGGVHGRQVELVTRDTQGDPTKAVNAVQEMISQDKVDAIWGPCNSGEALATTPIIARFKMPNVHPCVVDSLIDLTKYPTAFRTNASNTQWIDDVHNYCVDIMKAQKVGVVGDADGYGSAAVDASVKGFEKGGVAVVYRADIPTTQQDLMPDMIRMKDAGAQAIAVWSISIGTLSRLMNARDSLNWDVALVGNPAMGSKAIPPLLTKPQNWEKVYVIGYKNASIDNAGKLPPRTQQFVQRVNEKHPGNDTLLYWLLGGADGAQLVIDAVQHTNSTHPEALVEYWNHLSSFPGLLGTLRFSPTDHNGFQTDELVMSQANSQKDGIFTFAPGYH